MRKMVWLCLIVTLGSSTWASKSSACWWRRHVGCRHASTLACPQSNASPPAIATQPAPVSWPVTASAQARAAPSSAAVRTFKFKGKTYQAVQTNERGESEEHELRESSLTGAPARRSDGEHFNGSARKSAKTSFASGGADSFSSPGALLDSLLNGSAPQDNDRVMRSKLNANAPRASEEQRNATVTAFLYATKKESDNDFHLLIGDNPNGGDGRFMTAEVSGLPNPDNRLTPQFQQVRDAYRAFFTASGLSLPGERYVRFPQPIPITLTGSVFFDVDHTIGEVRSGNIIPETVWEIHPISDIVFDPNGGP